MSIRYDDLLRDSGLPRLEARLLMQQVSGLTHAGLISASEQSVPDELKQHFLLLVESRRAGVPIAYLLGQREFYGRNFSVNDNVLIPRPETEHLIDAALNRYPRAEDINVLDLGTGSGVLAVTLALEAPAWHVFATDVSAAALTVAQQNALNLHAQVTFYVGSWYQALPQKHPKFNLIVSNPPYISADDRHLKEGDLRFEPLDALTDHVDGLTCYSDIIGSSKNYLCQGGWLMLEHGFNQGASIRQLMHQASYGQVETLLDLAGLERLTIGCLQ